VVRKGDRPLFVNSKRYVPFKMYWTEVQGCFACEIIQLFSLVLCVVRAVHRFDFRLVVNETPNRWRPVDKSVMRF
jgi:hypothetical protein